MYDALLSLPSLANLNSLAITEMPGCSVRLTFEFVPRLPYLQHFHANLAIRPVMRYDELAHCNHTKFVVMI